MADRDMALDCRGGPWPLVPVLTCCPKCGGALPPDDVEACSTCGTGTPSGLPPVPLLVIEEHNLTEEEMVEAVGPPVVSARLSWARWARWPNHG